MSTHYISKEEVTKEHANIETAMSLEHFSLFLSSNRQNVIKCQNEQNITLIMINNEKKQ